MQRDFYNETMKINEQRVEVNITVGELFLCRRLTEESVILETSMLRNSHSFILIVGSTKWNMLVCVKRLETCVS